MAFFKAAVCGCTLRNGLRFPSIRLRRLFFIAHFLSQLLAWKMSLVLTAHVVRSCDAARMSQTCFYDALRGCRLRTTGFV